MILFILTIYPYSVSLKSQYRENDRRMNRFKKMIGQSKEGIAIVKDNNIIEYVNDQFLN
jgi:hypothetical protein